MGATCRPFPSRLCAGLVARSQVQQHASGLRIDVLAGPAQQQAVRAGAGAGLGGAVPALRDQCLRSAAKESATGKACTDKYWWKCN